MIRTERYAAFLAGYEAAMVSSPREPAADTWYWRGYAWALSTALRGVALPPDMAFARCHDAAPVRTSPSAPAIHEATLNVPLR